MTTPATIPVTTRQLSWKEICQRAEGKDWTKPETVYEFSGGRKFENTDQRQGGPYSPSHG
jgi:hypothetical protein